MKKNNAIVGVAAVAEMLGVSCGRVSQLLGEGRIEAERIGPARIFSLASIKRFMAKDRDRRFHQFKRRES